MYIRRSAHADMYIYMYLYVYIYEYTYVYIYIQIYANTYMYIHVCTYFLGFCQMVGSFWSEYGDMTHLQGVLVRQGNAALNDYPLLDRITRCYRLETQRPKMVDEHGRLVDIPLDDEL